MRCDESDPLYQVTFKKEGNFNVYGKRRLGRPRGHWAESTMEIALDKHHNMDFERDKDFFYLAIEGLKAPVPEQWK